MAWTATITSITKDAANQRITLIVTINGGSEPYTLTFVQGFTDGKLNQTQILNEIRNFVAKMKDVEEMYTILKSLEGQNIPLNL